MDIFKCAGGCESNSQPPAGQPDAQPTEPTVRCTNSSQTSYCTDLRIVGVYNKFVSFDIPSSCLFWLNGFEFIFLLRDSESDLHFSFRPDICICWISARQS